MRNPVLELKDISFQYDKNKQTQAPYLFEYVNLQIFEKEFVSIIGPSGSGKSTLFRLITGLEQPDNGIISINGDQKIDRLGQVGYMPQEDMLMPWRTILDNAALPLELKGMKKEQAYSKVKKRLAEFGLQGYENNYPDDLSGGMKQRVSFLRATLSGSNLLLLDEPFSALDAITKLSMQEWLVKQWSIERQSILFITHDVSEALFLSDRILLVTGNSNQPLQEVTVPIPRPRELHDLNETAVLKLKDDLIQQLRGR